MWILFAFSSAFFAGVTSILAKYGMKNINSNVATALRTIVVLLFSWLMVFLTSAQAGIPHISSKTWLFLILSGFATGASWLCYFMALKIGDINKVTPIDKSSTVLTMLLAMLFLHEAVTLTKLVALVFIGVGTFLMIQKKKLEVLEQLELNTPTVSNTRWMFYALASAFFASLTAILGKIGIQDVNSTLGTAIRTVVVLFMAWLVVFITGKQTTIGKIEPKSWLFLVLSGFATGGSWLFYYHALQTGPASIVVPIDKLSILVTIAFSYIVWKEKLNIKSAMGLVGIVLGTLLLLV
jgi:transporter family protein